MSDYYGDEICWTDDKCHGTDCFDCIVSIAEAVSAQNVGGRTTTAKGVDVNSADTSGINLALKLAAEAEVVVLALGIDKSIEHEGVDRVDTSLPGLQESFALQVLIALGYPRLPLSALDCPLHYRCSLPWVAFVCT